MQAGGKGAGRGALALRRIVSTTLVRHLEKPWPRGPGDGEVCSGQWEPSWAVVEHFSRRHACENRERTRAGKPAKAVQKKAATTYAAAAGWRHVQCAAPGELPAQITWAQSQACPSAATRHLRAQTSILPRGGTIVSDDTGRARSCTQAGARRGLKRGWQRALARAKCRPQHAESPLRRQNRQAASCTAGGTSNRSQGPAASNRM